MITNSQSIPPSLDVNQLRTVADLMREKQSLQPLAVRWEFEGEKELLVETARSLGLEWLEGEDLTVPPEAIDGFPIKLIHRHEVFPLERGEGWIRIAVSNPFDFHAIDAVATSLDLEVKSVVATPEAIRRLVKRYLGVGAETIDGLVALQSRKAGDVEMLEEISTDGSEDAEQAQQASVVRLVNEILAEAIEARASDIHVESQESGLKLRYRIDGVLQKQPTPAEMNQFRAAIVSRLKIMAKLNIAEKRVPQDGRIKLRVSGRE
ncbi:MAG: GspE/PulE family protein, partial [Pirellulaceae bacterium]